MIFKLKSLLLLGVALILGTTARADAGPFQLSLFDPIQLASSDESVSGLRIGLIYTVNDNVSGLDWGLVTKTTGDQVGIQVGAIHLVDGNFKGFQDGLYNRVSGDFVGWQHGVINITHGSTSGLQSGFYNRSGAFHGVQVGAWNSAESLDGGLQIGFLNFNKSGEPIGFLPIINFGF